MALPFQGILADYYSIGKNITEFELLSSALPACFSAKDLRWLFAGAELSLSLMFLQFQPV
jgi:hypothetical protein